MSIRKPTVALSLALVVIAVAAPGGQGPAPAAVTILHPARVFDGVEMHEGWGVRVRADRIDAAGPVAGLAITGARLTGHRLSLYLERAGLPASVSPILFGPSGMEVELARGETPSVIVETDPDRLATLLSAEERLTQAQVDRIVALLDPRQPLPRLAQATPGG